MLYQVQRSDGAMLVSKTSASSLKDINLLPNTSYGYILTVYKSIKKEVTIQSGPSKGQEDHAHGDEEGRPQLHQRAHAAVDGGRGHLGSPRRRRRSRSRGRHPSTPPTR